MTKDPRVLVIDDNTKILFAFDILLKKEGCLSIQATSGREGLKQIAQHQPNAVFLDVSLPDTDGISILQQIKESYPDLPVVIITGHGSEKLRERVTRYGAEAYLEKPLSLEKIREILTQLRG